MKKKTVSLRPITFNKDSNDSKKTDRQKILDEENYE
jgi:hypothetical protein